MEFETLAMVKTIHMHLESNAASAAIVAGYSREFAGLHRGLTDGSVPQERRNHQALPV
jgi:hypothetical protein